MDAATRQVLQARRDTLIAEVRRLDDQKRARIQVVTTSPDFNPMTHTMDGQVAHLISDQNRLIAQIEDIDRQLRG